MPKETSLKTKLIVSLVSNAFMAVCIVLLIINTALKEVEFDFIGKGLDASSSHDSSSHDSSSHDSSSHDSSSHDSSSHDASSQECAVSVVPPYDSNQPLLMASITEFYEKGTFSTFTQDTTNTDYADKDHIMVKHDSSYNINCYTCLNPKHGPHNLFKSEQAHPYYASKDMYVTSSGSTLYQYDGGNNLGGEWVSVLFDQPHYFHEIYVESVEGSSLTADNIEVIGQTSTGFETILAWVQLTKAQGSSVYSGNATITYPSTFTTYPAFVQIFIVINAMKYRADFTGTTTDSLRGELGKVVLKTQRQQPSCPVP